ncbi:MAG: DUF3024 domain-containing protein [Verrucomicrobia bacterium]|nr:DUF3024 domain-containing protein [Verrucomicrobiota bacterium]MDA1065446.1 DUF3024 domain-containing protein [Verrucomicrobiota bacterium]
MPFTDEQIAFYTEAIERIVWSKRRPPLDARDQVREGQRIEGNSVELFLVRAEWRNQGKWIEEPVAKATYVKSSKVWKVYWQRADLKWHPYEGLPEVENFEDFLNEVEEDPYCCFWG